MTVERQKLGQRAEDAAVSYLKSQGYHILKRNYRTRFAEIDIIANQAGFLVFIEVKARKNLNKGSPKEAVTLFKQKKIILAANQYMKENRLVDIRVRFDVVALLAENSTFKIECVTNAFQAV